MSYENVFIPRVELLVAAGRDAITEFGDRAERNLIVIPETYLFDLERTVQTDIVHARGAREVLKYINQTVSKKHSFKDNDTQFSEPATVGETLDISLARNTLRGQSLEEIVTLAQEAQKHFASETTVITRSEAEKTSLELRGITVEKPKFMFVSADIVKNGLIEGNDELFTELYSNDEPVPLEHAREIMGLSEHQVRTNQVLFPNQFISFENPADERNHGVAYAKVTARVGRNKEGYLFERGREIRLLHLGGKSRKGIYGVKPENDLQYLALEHLLLNDDISLAFITGGHGTGKTLLSYVAALHGIDMRNGGGRYDQIAIFKPNDIMGGDDRNLGYEPGDRGQKTRAIMESYADAHKETDLGFPFELMQQGTIESDFDPQYRKQKIDEKRLRSGARGNFPWEIAPLTNPWSGFVRGRTFKRTVMIIDETQQYRPYEVNTLIQRSGRGTKIVVMGDPFQLDSEHSRNTVESNGLTAAIKGFQGEPFFGLMHLETNYRSHASNKAKNMRTY